MARRVFTKCLNQELKIFNFSVGSLIGGGILLVLGALSKGLMWGIGAGVPQGVGQACRILHRSSEIVLLYKKQ